MGVLTIVLEKIFNLRDSDGVGKSDPYVKFELVQDNVVLDKKYGIKQSTMKPNDLSPVYNETFEYAGIPSLSNMVLHVRIMDDDVGLDDKLGGCNFKLDHLHLNETPKSIQEGCDKKKATIHLKLSYRD